jgi:hypothetical protein
MKYNPSITVFSFGRTGLVMKRRNFYGLMGLLLVLASWFYWLYLQHLTHVGGYSASRFFSAAKAVSQVQPTVPAARLAPVLKNPVVPTPAPPAPVAKPVVPKAVTTPAMAAPVATAPPVRMIIAKGVKMILPPISAPMSKPAIRPQPQCFSETDPLSQAGLQAFGGLINMAGISPDTCGFLPDDLLLDARLGEPIPVYQISDQECANYHAGQPVKPLLKPADRWVFPVLIGTQIRCMVQVTRNGHNYVPGSGSKMLALAWNKILEKWPAAEGFHPQLLIHPEIPGYYFTVPELAEQTITETDQMIFSHGDLSPAAVTLASWR